jgi:predicted nucleic acid-binding protein
LILVDTSAWIDFLRATERPAHRAVRQLLLDEAELAITEPVVMELLAGARSSREAEDLVEQLLAFPLLPLEGLRDFEDAAHIYRTCREAGETVRSQIDCLIAVPAIRAGASLLHADRDFDVIARHTDLSIHPLDGA